MLAKMTGALLAKHRDSTHNRVLSVNACCRQLCARLRGRPSLLKQDLVEFMEKCLPK